MKEIFRFDVNRLIVRDGVVYALTTKENVNDGSDQMNICMLCALRGACDMQSGTLCRVHGVSGQEYYTEVANIRRKRGEWFLSEFMGYHLK